MDDAGYTNLMKVVSQAHLGPGEAEPAHIAFDFLQSHAAGLIVLTGDPTGPSMPRCAKDQCDRGLPPGPAEGALRRQALRGAAAPRPRDGEMVEPRLLQLAYALELPIVATNEAYFASRMTRRTMRSCASRKALRRR